MASKRKLNRVKEVLDKQGRSQTWLSKELGVTINTMNNMCQNKTYIKLNVLYDIAKLLDEPVCSLLVDAHIKPSEKKDLLKETKPLIPEKTHEL